MDQKKKLNPIQRIAEELEPHSSLEAGDLEEAFISIMELLKNRAEKEIGADPMSEASTTSAREFLAYTELMTLFGGSLLAYDEANPDGHGEELPN